MKEGGDVLAGSSLASGYKQFENGLSRDSLTRGRRRRGQRRDPSGELCVVHKLRRALLPRSAAQTRPGSRQRAPTWTEPEDSSVPAN